MKKTVTGIILFLISILFFNACTVGGREMFFDIDDRVIDNKMKQFVKALENQDKDTLKSMFSKRVLDEVEDFDEKLDLLSVFIGEEDLSWNRTGGPGTEEGINDDGTGRIWKEIFATYDIETSERSFHASIKICSKDKSSDAIGIISFCIIRAEDWIEEYNYWGDLDVPGIVIG